MRIANGTQRVTTRRNLTLPSEALETAIYIAEVAKKYGDSWMENAVRAANDTSNPGLPRTAFKIATDSGNTVLIAMLRLTSDF